MARARRTDSFSRRFLLPRRRYEEIRARERQQQQRFSENDQRRSRILLRDSYDHQSMGRWNIKRVGGDWLNMYLDDWFNTIVHLPFLRLMGLLCLVYILVVFVFALAYLSFADKCGMDFSDRIEAYYFSLETMATIGYGTQDYFFGHCWEPLVIINVQVVCSLVIESLYFGIIFHRLTRGRKRQSTVLFSDKAVVRRVGDAFYLVFQVCELRRHHLLDARIRVYAVRHERDAHGTAYYQAHRMALRRPNEASGGLLLMALPQLVVHKLDASSPLVPGRRWISARGARRWSGLGEDRDAAARAASIASPHKKRTVRRLPSTDVRMFAPRVPHEGGASPVEGLDDDDDDGDFDDDGLVQADPDAGFAMYDAVAAGATPAAARPAADDEARRARSADREAAAATPLCGLPTEPPEVPRAATPPAHRPRFARDEAREFREELEAFFFDRDVEIVAIVEGVDDITSRLVQARHSYALENFAWWHNFAPCVFRQPGGSCLVDFGEFHRTVDPSLGAASPIL